MNLAAAAAFNGVGYMEVAQVPALPAERVAVPVQEAGDKVITFPRGLVGFKGPMYFTVTALPGAEDRLYLLCSTDNPELAFTLVNPRAFFTGYHPRASAQDLEECGLESEDDAIWMCIATVPRDYRQTTVNLRAPLLINPVKRLAKQVVLVGDYPVRQPLFQVCSRAPADNPSGLRGPGR